MKIETPYYTITPESIARERERLFEKARHDEAQALRHAEQRGEQRGIQKGMQKGISRRSVEIARKMLADSEPIERIMRYTDLTAVEIEELVQQL